MGGDNMVEEGEKMLDLSHLSTTSTRSKIAYWMESSGVGVMWDIFQIVLSLLAMGLYMASTYQDERAVGIFITEIVLTLIFSIDYALRMYLAAHKVDHFFSFFPMVDFLSIVPFVVEEVYKASTGVNDGGPTLQFLRLARFLRIMRLLRIMKMYRIFRLAKSEVERGILELVFVVLCLVFISAGLIFEAENPLNPKFEYFHSTLYFIVVALSTVGFGDMYPESEFGRFVMMVIICAGLVIVPLQTSRVVELVRLERRYLGSYMGRPDQRHIVVAGHLSAEEMLGFIKEFYHINHQGGELREGTTLTAIVFLSPRGPSQAMEAILNSPTLPLHSVKYLKGSLTDDGSMTRAGLARAKAVFLLADNFAPPNKDEDASNILALIVMLRHLMKADDYTINPVDNSVTANSDSRAEKLISHLDSAKTGKVKTFIQLMDTKNEERVCALPLRNLRCTVSVHSLKMRILGFGCCNPGGLALLHNLTRSFAFSERLDRPSKSSADVAFDAYLRGIDNEIYRVDLTAEGGHFRGILYKDLVQMVFRHFGALVIGIEMLDEDPASVTRSPGGRSKMVRLKLMPPGDFVVGSTGGPERAYLIATSKDICSIIEKWNPASGPPAMRMSQGGTVEVVETPRGESMREGVVRRLSGMATKVTPAPEIPMTQLEPPVEESILIPELKQIAAQLCERCTIDSGVGAGGVGNEASTLRRPALPPEFEAGLGNMGVGPSPSHLDPILGRSVSFSGSALQPTASFKSGRMRGGGLLQGHILICGPLKGIDILVTSIRQDVSHRDSSIVVLDNSHNEEQKCKLEELDPGLMVVYGSCRVESDLQRVAFMSAERVIVLADYVSGQEEQGVARDMSAVLVSMSMSAVEVPPLLFLDLVEAENTQYLHPLEIIPHGLSGEYSLWPQFAAGRVWPSSTLDSLICQVFYSQALLITLEAMLPRSADEESMLWQLPLPPSLAGKTFQCVMESLYNLSEMEPLFAIGIFRNPPSNVFGKAGNFSPRPARPRANSNSHFIVDDTLAESAESPKFTGSELNLPEGEGTMHKKQAYAIVCPKADLVMEREDVLFVMGNKRVFLGL